MKVLLHFIFFTFPFLFTAQIQTDVKLIKYEELENLISANKDQFLVVNFWATTCAPCVKELPHFIDINNEYAKNPKFKMLLVSLDMERDKQKVVNFIKSKNISAKVVILSDNKRMNTWIPRFDENWGGEIPATFFYNNGEKIFFQNGEMSKDELETLIKTYFKL